MTPKTFCKPVYTKHFAERFLERHNADMKLLRKIKRELQDKYCQYVFDCLVRGDHQQVRVDSARVTICFNLEQRKLLVTTVY
jgi:hypothetical protein